MADTEPTPVVMISSDEAGRRELAREMAKLRKNSPHETVPGGRYLNAAGETVNAHGKVLEAAASEDGAENEQTASKKGRK